MSDNNSSNSNKQQSSNASRIVYIVLLVLFIVILMFQFFSMDDTTVEEISTSEFVTAVEDDRVVEVTYNASTGVATGTYRAEGTTETATPIEFQTTYVGEETLNELMAEHPDTVYDVNVSSNSVWLTLLTTLIPIILILVIFWVFMNQMQGANSKQMQFGKTKAKKTDAERPKVRFSDVAGIDEAVEELQEIKDYLSNPSKYQRMGAKIPHGVLLVGPPGTGKTLLAKAVAGEAGVPFFSISGSDFVEMFVGVGASRVRDLFDQAKAAAPSIIFIDEIDAVGRQRGAGLGGGHDEREQTLNQLLVEMDGFDEHESVILIAATNRVDILDPALLRPGRFDRQITVDRPDVAGREQILRVHAKGKPLASNIDLERYAQLTSGFTGADLANLMNEAALLAARRGRNNITNDEMDEALERVIAGPERKGRIITEQEKKTVAYHESGHALVGHKLQNADPIHKISIIARGQALGYTLSIPEEDHYLATKSHMTDELAMFLGGRVAEEIAMGDVTTGASNDLERATKQAKDMVTRYGMTDALGHQVYGEANHEVFLGRDYSATPDYSDETARRIDAEVSKLMNQAHDVAYKILTENREQLDLMASVLLERETVEGEAVQALLDNKWDEYLAKEDQLKEQKRLAEARTVQEESRPGVRLAPRERSQGNRDSRANQIAQKIRGESGSYEPFDPPKDGKPIDDSSWNNGANGSGNAGEDSRGGQSTGTPAPTAGASGDGQTASHGQSGTGVQPSAQVPGAGSVEGQTTSSQGAPATGETPVDDQPTVDDAHFAEYPTLDGSDAAKEEDDSGKSDRD